MPDQEPIKPPKLCPFMSGFAFGPIAPPAQGSRLAIAQAGPPIMGVQFYGAACEHKNCELWDEIQGCSFKKEAIRG